MAMATISFWIFPLILGLGPKYRVENPSKSFADFWGHKLVIDTEFNQLERIWLAVGLPFSFRCLVCFLLFFFNFFSESLSLYF